jgi:hypothetical protein
MTLNPILFQTYLSLFPNLKKPSLIFQECEVLVIKGLLQKNLYRRFPADVHGLPNVVELNAYCQLINKPSAFVIQMPVPAEKQNKILFLVSIKYFIIFIYLDIYSSTAL